MAGTLIPAILLYHRFLHPLRSSNPLHHLLPNLIKPFITLHFITAINFISTGISDIKNNRNIC